MNEKIIVDAGAGYPLDGILCLPDDLSNPVPAVVMVHGSGSSNMDEKVMKLTPFRDLAEGLQKRGIASIRYDKRSFAYGRKMLKEKTLITVREEAIDDALAAVKMLKDDPRIDSGSIYILGHSMGAMLTPRIDAEGADVKGYIMMAGSPFRLEEILQRQLLQLKGKNFLINWIIGMQYKAYAEKFANLYEMSDEEAKKTKFGGGTTLYYFKEMGRKTASDYLLESTKPVLIMQGGMDFQCLADVDYKTFQEKLAGRENTVFRWYPELNHVFVNGIYNDIAKVSKEYKVEQHIGDKVFDDIAGFICDNN